MSKRGRERDKEWETGMNGSGGEQFNNQLTACVCDIPYVHLFEIRFYLFEIKF